MRVRYLQFLLSLQGELFEGLDDDARVGAVVHKYGRAAHPRLQVVDGEGDVLGVVLRSGRKHSRRYNKLYHIRSIYKKYNIRSSVKWKAEKKGIKLNISDSR